MEKKVRVCDECGREIDSEGKKTGGFPEVMTRCSVCGKEICFDCVRALYGGRDENNEAAYDIYEHLCPTHYKQVKECINILKGEKMPKPLPLYKGAPSGHPATYGVFVSPSEIWMSGVKFVPEKPKVWYAAEKDEDGYAIWRHDTGADTITFYTQIGNEQAEALYNQMRRERGEPDERD